MNLRMFGEREIASLLPFPTLIAYMQHALATSVTVPLRMAISGIGGREFLVMPAVSDDFAGVKMLSVVPGNGDNGQPVNGGLFVLFDAKSGTALATMHASELTARRTAAVSALACRQLARPDAARLLVVGTGHLAPYLAEAHCQVVDIHSVSIWGRRRESIAACINAVRARLPGMPVDGVEDLEDAVRGSDVISAATRSRDPVIHGKWLKEGAHLDLVGGYRPDMREIDDAGIARASIFVDTREGALAEAGDLRSPLERGVITESAILGDMAALLGGAGRANESEITLFKTVGSAASDLIAAQLVWQTANG